jgi:hypothetical protein
MLHQLRQYGLQSDSMERIPEVLIGHMFPPATEYRDNRLLSSWLGR